MQPLYLYLVSCCVVTLCLLAYSIFRPGALSEYADDISVLMYVLPTALCYTHITTRCACNILFAKCRRLLLVFITSGWIRVVAFAVFVCVFSYLFVVVVLDGLWTASRGFVQESLVRRLEDNIIHVKETRPFSLRTSMRTDSYHNRHDSDKQLDSQSHLYEGEDGAVTCTSAVAWFPKDLPPRSLQSIIFYFNGTPFDSLKTDKHVCRFCRQQTAMINESVYTDDAKEYGLAVYTFNTTLIVEQMEASDFGVYTCKGIDYSKYWFIEWAFILKTFEFLRKYQSVSKDDFVHAISRFLVSVTPDMVSQNAGLSKAEKKTIVISGAPGSILSFETSYIQYETDPEEVQAEMFINGIPYHIVGSLWDCSIFLLLYWMTVHGECGLVDPFCMPPFLRNYRYTIDIMSQLRTAVFTVCLGDQTFGHYHVEYSRPSFKHSLGRYELLTFHHPNDLVVLPREQDMFSGVITNYTPSKKVPGSFENRIPTSMEMHFIKEAASARAREFHALENIAIAMTVVFAAIFCVIGLTVVRYVSRIARRRILHTSLQARHLVTRTATEQLMHDEHILHALDPEEQFSQKAFDVFLSYSDSDTGFIASEILPLLENGLGQRVCFRERDVPPNLPEISALDAGIRNSDRYIIFLSSDYLQDSVRKNLEARVIVDQALDGRGPQRTGSREPSSRDSSRNHVTGVPSGPEDVLLVVKLGRCRAPTWLRGYAFQDWTTCLSREDNLRRLSQWTVAMWRRPARQELKDVFQRGAILWLLLGLMMIILGLSLKQ